MCDMEVRGRERMRYGERPGNSPAIGHQAVSGNGGRGRHVRVPPDGRRPGRGWFRSAQAMWARAWHRRWSRVPALIAVAALVPAGGAGSAFMAHAAAALAGPAASAAADPPHFTVVKTANVSSFSSAGTRITYRYQVTNSGFTPVSDLSIYDTRLGAITRCSGYGPIRPGGVRECTATYTTTGFDVLAGRVSNTVFATGVRPPFDHVRATDSLVIPFRRTASIGLVKTATPNTFSAAGQLITYRFGVVNDGDAFLTGVSVTDSRLGGIRCPLTSLAPGQFMTCTGFYPTTPGDVAAGLITNTATVTGRPSGGGRVSDTSSETVRLQHIPQISIVEYADVESYSQAGTLITYSFEVTNEGNVTLNPVRVTDTLGLRVSCPHSRLAPGQDMTCTASYVTTSADVDRGSITDTGTATGTTPGGGTVTDASTLTIDAVQAPGISISKTASVESFSEAGTEITYFYHVTNEGNVTLSPVQVTDSRGLTVGCPHSRLSPGQDMTCTAVYVTTAGDVDNGGVTNTGTVTGTTPGGGTVTDASTLTIDAVQAPGISISKTASVESYSQAGTPITYFYDVTNEGNVTLNGVSVTDSLGLPAGCPLTTLTAGQEMQCTGSYVTTVADVDRGSITNIATATGTGPGGPVSDTAELTIEAVPAPGISIDKTASVLSFQRPWMPITYYYEVTNDGNVTLSKVQVADSRGLAVSCPQYMLVPGQVMICTAHYVTSSWDVKRGSIVNTGTVTAWTPDWTELADQSTLVLPVTCHPEPVNPIPPPGPPVTG
jgi:uncharacterized repeat protein (TIGR01451 family)